MGAARDSDKFLIISLVSELSSFNNNNLILDDTDLERKLNIEFERKG